MIQEKKTLDKIVSLIAELHEHGYSEEEIEDLFEESMIIFFDIEGEDEW